MAKSEQKIEEVKLATDGALGASTLVHETILKSPIKLEVTHEGKKVVWGSKEVSGFLKNQLAITQSNAKHENQIKNLDTDKFKAIVFGTVKHVESAINSSSLKNANQAVKSKVLEDVFDSTLFVKGKLSKTPEDVNHISSLYQMQKKAVNNTAVVSYNGTDNMTDWSKAAKRLSADATGGKILDLIDSEKIRVKLNDSLAIDKQLSKKCLEALDMVNKEMIVITKDLTTISEAKKAEKAKTK